MRGWVLKVKALSRGGSRTAVTSEMELFVIIVNGWKPFTGITQSSILDVAPFLDPPLIKFSAYEIYRHKSARVSWVFRSSSS